MADGSVVMRVDLNVSKAEQRLAKLKTDIQSLEASIRVQEAQRSPLEIQAERLNQIIQGTRIAVQGIYDDWHNGDYTLGPRYDYMQSELWKMEAEYDKIATSIDKIDIKLMPAYAKLDGMKETAGALQAEIEGAAERAAELAAGSLQTEVETKGAAERAAELAAGALQAEAEIEGAAERAAELAAQLGGAATETSQIGNNMDSARKKMNKFMDKFKNVAIRQLMYRALSVVFRAISSIGKWFYSAIKTNDEAVASIAKLKGALLTMVQPIVEVVIPAFTKLVNLLTLFISGIAKVFAILHGTTVEKSAEAAENLYNEMEALEGTGDAAKKAAKSLASFDEINQLTSQSASGSSSTDSITPDFSGGILSELEEERLKNILGIIGAIGTALLAWRIHSKLGSAMVKVLGLALAIYSAVKFVKNIMDAWTNSVNWDNLLNILLSAAGLVAGLWLVFGKVGAGIGLIVTGLTMLATGFHDAATNGWDLQNTLLTIAGIMATGIGIGILVGSFIPILIAAIASLLLAVTTAFGEGENLIEGLKKMLQGFIDFFSGIFTGDFEKTIKGIGEIFGGLQEIFDSILNAIHNMIDSFFDWLDEKSNGKFSGLLGSMREFFHAVVDLVQDLIGGVIEWLQGTFEGLIMFLSGVFTGDWDKAWEGLVKIGKSAVNLLISAVESFANFFIRAINAVIGALNKISVTVPDWVPGIGGKKFGFGIPKIKEINLPRLAEGAVIPPNREFLAVLGDQRSGTNIETPLSTMVEAFKQAMAESGGGGTFTCVVNLDGREIARNTVRHMNDMTRERGKPVVLV